MFIVYTAPTGRAAGNDVDHIGGLRAVVGAGARPACPGAADNEVGVSGRRRRGATEEVDGVGRLPGDWREDRAMAWRQLCAIAAARRGAWDATKAKKFALAQYKQLYGDWPRWEIRRRADAPQTPTHTVRPHNAESHPVF